MQFHYLVPATLAVALLVPGLPATSARADTGRLEINQACALSGCFPGDAPAYPVTIAEPGSYVLTGNLDLSSDPLAQTAIVISTPGVWLDLNGHHLTGSASCTGSGPTLDCTPARVDVPGIRIEQAADGAVVRNGSIRNFPGHGVEGFARGIRLSGRALRHNVGNGLLAQAQARISDATAFENFGHGMQAAAGSLIDNATAFANKVDGFRTLGPGSVVAGNTATGNGASGFTLGPRTQYANNVSLDNGGLDSCGDGVCSSRKRYYLSTASSPGSQALTACADGFHMAALYEIIDPSNLAYDTFLGLTIDDSGSGPWTFEFGWIRTGQGSRTDSIAGLGNCQVWTSASADHNGSVAALRMSWDGVLGAHEPTDPWQSDTRLCSGNQKVWCVED